MKKNLFPKFTTVISLYYISYAVIYGFVTVFMQYRHFTNTEIGLSLACASVLCILLQYFSGSFLDRHPDLSVKTIMLISFILVYGISIILFLVKMKWFIFFSYTIVGAIMLAGASFSNMFGMEYLNSNIPLNYSLARGIGSFCFAGTSLLMGSIIKLFSVMSIFPVFFVVHLLLLLSLLFIHPAPRSVYDNPFPKEHTKKMDPLFLFLLASLLLVYISYTSVYNFQINIVTAVGGGSQEMGISNCIAAMLELPAMALFIPLSKKFSYGTLLKTSCLFFFFKITAFYFADHIWGIYLAQCLQFFSYGLFVPASSYFINSILPPQDKSKGQSALGIFTFGLSGLISSLLSGILLDLFTVKTMLALESLLTFIGVIGVFIACHFMQTSKSKI